MYTDDNLIFGQIGLNDKVSDCPYKVPFDINALLEHFGREVTWKDILAADHNSLQTIRGFGAKTLDKLYAFTASYVKYSFSDLLS